MTATIATRVAASLNRLFDGVGVLLPAVVVVLVVVVSGYCFEDIE
jgi:hypothetical protein